jgi:hypothetical protein
VSRDDVLRLLRLLGRTLLWLLMITVRVAGFCLLVMATIMVGALKGAADSGNRGNRGSISGMTRQSRRRRF